MKNALLALAVCAAIRADVTSPGTQYTWRVPDYEPPSNLKPRKATKGWHKKNQRKKGNRK